MAWNLEYIRNNDGKITACLLDDDGEEHFESLAHFAASFDLREWRNPADELILARELTRWLKAGPQRGLGEVRPEVTADRLRKLLSYDAETGVFRWKMRTSNRVRVGDEAGNPTTHGYLECAIDGVTYKQHRLAWLYVYGEWPTGDIDHIDGVTSNNRIANLRSVTHTENMQNLKKAKIHNKAGLLGVYKVAKRRNNPWLARIKVGGKQLTVGCYATPEEAHQAYLRAKRKLHPGCTI